MRSRSKWPTQKGKVGRPAKCFTTRELRHVYTLAVLGATDVQIAQHFNVSPSTVEHWMKTNDQFRKTRKKGGIEADMEVAQSLFKRATGYTILENEYESIRNKKTGAQTGLDLVRTKEKHIAPDVRAAIHWLSVRQRETWGQQAVKHEHSMEGKVEHFHKGLNEINVEELPQAAQDALFEITRKQIELPETPS